MGTANFDCGTGGDADITTIIYSYITAVHRARLRHVWVSWGHHKMQTISTFGNQSLSMLHQWSCITTCICIHMYLFWEWISSMWNISGILECPSGPSSSLLCRTAIPTGQNVTCQPDMIWTKCKRYPPCILIYDQTQCHSEVRITRYALAQYPNDQMLLCASCKYIRMRSIITYIMDNDYLEHVQVESICSDSSYQQKVPNQIRVSFCTLRIVLNSWVLVCTPYPKRLQLGSQDSLYRWYYGYCIFVLNP
jgi:hypothetical protein